MTHGSNRKQASGEGAFREERPASTPIHRRSMSGASVESTSSSRMHSRRQSQSQMVRRPSVTSSQRSQSVSSSRSSSSVRVQSIPPAYETVYQSILETITQPTHTGSNASVFSYSTLNLKNLAPIVSDIDPVSQQIMAFGKLTLLSSKTTTHYDASITAKIMLLTPDARIWPKSTPINLYLNHRGLSTDKTTSCEGLCGLLNICSDEILRQGILVFFQANEGFRQALDQTKPQYSVLRRLHIFMVGYARNAEKNKEDEYEITSHPGVYRRPYDFFEGPPGSPFTWGLSRHYCDQKYRLPENDALVCFFGVEFNGSTMPTIPKDIHRLVAY